MDEKSRTAVLTEEGVARAEKLLKVENLYDLTNIDMLHGTEQALRAHTLYKKDVDYMIKDGQVLIVDEFTGRVLPGRRWSDGLHQAVEAKEGVRIERENQTLATITLQNYFRMYEKLAGMTGTADTEASEFHQIYKLDVVVVPTNVEMIRADNQDVVYASEREKYEAVSEEIVHLREKGQPVLVGTVSIEKSELLSAMLKGKKVPHVVLNAKFHEKEAEIVAQAGKSGSVTIATNMAGRGTDIVLGGNPEAFAEQRRKEVESEEAFAKLLAELKAAAAKDREKVLAAGGLFIMGTERHESRRVDNQLRGRSGRQGDPGESRFYLSLEDDLMRIFGSDRLQKIMRRLGMEEGVPIEHRHGLPRDRARAEAGGGAQLRDAQAPARVRRRHEPPAQRDLLPAAGDPEGEAGEGESPRARRDDPRLPPGPPFERRQGPGRVGPPRFPDRSEGILRPGRRGRAASPKRPGNRSGKTCSAELTRRYDAKEKLLGPETMRLHEKFVMLQVVDQQWKDHLLALDHLKEGIGLRGYGQRDPLVEYKKESFELFTLMKERIEDQFVQYLFRLQPVLREAEGEVTEGGARRAPAALPSRRAANVNYSYGAAASGGQDAKVETFHRNAPKVGRNDPCPCGSGRKFKKCHGAEGGAAPVTGGGKRNHRAAGA